MNDVPLRIYAWSIKDEDSLKKNVWGVIRPINKIYDEGVISTPVEYILAIKSELPEILSTAFKRLEILSVRGAKDMDEGILALQSIEIIKNHLTGGAK